MEAPSEKPPGAEVFVVEAAVAAGAAAAEVACVEVGCSAGFWPNKLVGAVVGAAAGAAELDAAAGCPSLNSPPPVDAGAIDWSVLTLGLICNALDKPGAADGAVAASSFFWPKPEKAVDGAAAAPLELAEVPEGLLRLPKRPPAGAGVEPALESAGGCPKESLGGCDDSEAGFAADEGKLNAGLGASPVDALADAVGAEKRLGLVWLAGAAPNNEGALDDVEGA